MAEILIYKHKNLQTNYNKESVDINPLFHNNKVTWGLKYLIILYVYL